MFTTQIDELCKKLSKCVGLLHHISPYLKQKQCEIYYCTIIKPVLLYGSTVWCSCKQDDLQRVLKLQKRAARVILNADRRACSVDLFNTLGWLPFYIEAHISTRLAPSYINDLLIRNCDIHNRNTRYSKLNLNCPRYKRESEGRRTFTVTTIKAWNSITSDLKKSHSPSIFKRNFFKYFLTKQREMLTFESFLSLTSLILSIPSIM